MELWQRNLDLWLASIDMNMIVTALIVMVAAYLIGSINTSIIVGKLKSNIDIRDHGSGNAGMTNAMRTMGKKAGILVLLGDALKAAIILTAVRIIFRDETALYTYIYAAGMGVVFGHNFPIFFKFKGGKGIVVSVVAIFFASWPVGLASLAVGLLIILITKYVSLGSILGGMSAVGFAFIFNRGNMQLVAFLAFLAILSIKMHRENIVRLFNGTENKVGRKK